LQTHPFRPCFPPFAQLPAALDFAAVAAAVVNPATVALPTAPAAPAAPAVAHVGGALLADALSGPAGFMPYPRNVQSPFSLSLGGAWAPVNLLYLCASLRVFFPSLLPMLPLQAQPAAVAAAAAVGAPYPQPQSLQPWTLTIADLGGLGTFFTHTFAPLPAQKQAGPFRGSGDFDDETHYTHPDYAALTGRPAGWVFESPPPAAAAAAAAAAEAALGLAPGHPVAARYGRPQVPPLSPGHVLFARFVVDPMPSLPGPVLPPAPAGAAGWPPGPPEATFL